MHRVCDAPQSKSRFPSVPSGSHWPAARQLFLTYHGSQLGVCVNNRHENRSRSFLAALCLLAVMLLYAPLGAVAFSAYANSCCSSGQCPIKGQHQNHAPAASEHAMDCGHEMPGMASCSLSCCHHPDRPALVPAIFVLPAAFTVSTSVIFEPVAQVRPPLNYLLSSEPLSPPPRSSSAAA